MSLEERARVIYCDDKTTSKRGERLAVLWYGLVVRVQLAVLPLEGKLTSQRSAESRLSVRVPHKAGSSLLSASASPDDSLSFRAISKSKQWPTLVIFSPTLSPSRLKNWKL